MFDDSDLMMIKNSRLFVSSMMIKNSRLFVLCLIDV